MSRTCIRYTNLCLSIFVIRKAGTIQQLRLRDRQYVPTKLLPLDAGQALSGTARTTSAGRRL
jgi:hypothetical protein